MDSAGKRNNTEGTARGKRKLEDVDKKEAEPSRKAKLDDNESELSSLDSAELEKLAKSIEDSAEPQATQPAPSTAPAPGPAPAPAPAPGPAPAPAPAPGPSQPTPKGRPEPLSPKSYETSPDSSLTDGEGIPVEDNDA